MSNSLNEARMVSLADKLDEQEKAKVQAEVEAEKLKKVVKKSKKIK